MGGNRKFGVLWDDLAAPVPQYPVVGHPHNHFKLCDFPLVSPITLLY